MDNNDIKDLYDYTVREIDKIDKEMEHLRGKREAYNDLRLELFNLIHNTKDESED